MVSITTTIESLIALFESRKKTLTVDFVRCFFAHNHENEFTEIICIALFVWQRSIKVLSIDVDPYLKQYYPLYQPSLDAAKELLKQTKPCGGEHVEDEVKWFDFGKLLMRFGIGINEDYTKRVENLQATLDIVSYLPRFHRRQTCINLWRYSHNHKSLWLFSEIMASLPSQQFNLMEVMHKCLQFHADMNAEFFEQLLSAWSKVDATNLHFNVTSINLQQYMADVYTTLGLEDRYFAAGVPDDLTVLEDHIKYIDYKRISELYWLKYVKNKPKSIKYYSWLVLEILLRFGKHECLRLFNENIHTIYVELVKASRLLTENSKIDLALYEKECGLALRSVGLNYNDYYTKQLALMHTLHIAVENNIKSRQHLQNIRIAMQKQGKDYLAVFECFYCKRSSPFDYLMQIVSLVENVIDFNFLNKMIQIVNDTKEIVLHSVDKIHESNLLASQLLQERFNMRGYCDHEIYDVIAGRITQQMATNYWAMYLCDGNINSLHEETWCIIELLLNFDFQKVKHVLYTLPSYVYIIYNEIINFKITSSKVLKFDTYISHRTCMFKTYEIVSNDTVKRELRIFESLEELIKTLKPDHINEIRTSLIKHKSESELYELMLSSSKSIALKLSSLSLVINLYKIVMTTLKKYNKDSHKNIPESLIQWFHDKVKKNKSSLRKSYVDNDYKSILTNKAKQIEQPTILNETIDVTTHNYKSILPRYWYNRVRLDESNYDTWLALEISVYFSNYYILDDLRLLRTKPIPSVNDLLKGDAIEDNLQEYRDAQGAALRALKLSITKDQAYEVHMLKEIFDVIYNLSTSEILHARGELHDTNVYPKIFGLIFEVITSLQWDDMYQTMKKLRPIEREIDLKMLECLLDLLIYIKFIDEEPLFGNKRLKLINENVATTIAIVLALKEESTIIQPSPDITPSPPLLPSPPPLSSQDQTNVYALIGGPILFWSVIATGVVMYNSRKS
uniref:Putative helicase of the dead superfamily n=1 Tax=Ixodes ricinus TaxID=34613 RepID=A0A0K8R7J7_IXORI